MSDTKRIEVALENNNDLVVEHNTYPEGQNEIYVGIVDRNGVWTQDIVTIRPIPSTNKYEVLVYADASDEDYTNRFVIDTYREISE